MSASASQRKTLSIYDQLELINNVKVKKLKLAAAAKKYGIGYLTAAKIIKKEDDPRSCMQMSGNTNRKRKRQSVHKDVNEALTQWFTQSCAHGATVTDHVIRQKASQLAVNLEVNFEPSNGWLLCWKQANNISFKKFHGESTSADHGSANEWVTNVLPQLFRGYDPKDVWNCDETGLFYKSMPSGSLRFAGDEQSNETKVPKDRLTTLQFTNMDGSEKQAVVVGKLAKPCCFKNVKTLSFSYFVNRKIYMTTDVMKTLDRKMIAQNRKIILFLDNATCHNLLPGTNLSNIKLSFMPPNTTSLIQPLDQGIIRSFKAYYRRELVRMQIAAIDATPPVPLYEVTKQITVLKAIHMMKRALFMVKPSTIQNCFKKADFVIESQAEVGEILDENDQVSPPSGIEQTDFDEFISFDDPTQCYGELTDTDITRGIKSDNQDFDEDDDAESVSSKVSESDKPVPNSLSALNALETLTAYFEAKSSNPDGALKKIYGLYESVHDVNKVISVLSKMTDFFKKK